MSYCLDMICNGQTDGAILIFPGNKNFFHGGGGGGGGGDL